MSVAVVFAVAAEAVSYALRLIDDHPDQAKNLLGTVSRLMDAPKASHPGAMQGLAEGIARARADAAQTVVRRLNAARNGTT